MLFLVSTPIGNLQDFSFRAIETLKTCDWILCEDTRRSQILLNHYQIHKPLKSYHQFNQSASRPFLEEAWGKGATIGFISDAGTPGISDPGQELVPLARACGATVVVVPGACAVIGALSASGFSADRFQFVGFLPKKPKSLRESLQDILDYQGTSICYESPFRLQETLLQLAKMAPHRPVAVVRELTKVFEEVVRGTAEELSYHWKDSPPKGEIVLLIAYESKQDSTEWAHLTPEEHIQWVQESLLLSRKEAIQLVAKQRGISKKTLYTLP
mgnify:CR=1 FL=1